MLTLPNAETVKRVIVALLMTDNIARQTWIYLNLLLIGEKMRYQLSNLEIITVVDVIIYVSRCSNALYTGYQELTSFPIVVNAAGM